MGIVGLLISRGVRFMADGLNGPTNEEARELLEIRLEEAQARHAEDLERLGREMSEVVAQPLQARLDVARRVERDVRTALCASMSECTDVAARRVAGERDLARAERDKYFQACENWRKLDAPLSEFRRVLRVGDYESTLDAARRMSRELEVCLGQLDHVTAREKSTNLEAYALGRKSAEEQEAAWESERAELVAQRDGALGNIRDLRNRHVEAYAVLGAAIGEHLDAAARRVVAERDAMAAELAAIRAATGEEPSDDGLFKVGVTARFSCSDVPNANLAERRALYNLGRNAAHGEVAMMREAARGRDATIETLRTQQEEQAEEVATLRDRVDGLEIDLNSAVQNSKASEVEANNLRSANRTLRARVAELEAAPVGLPVATDEELWEVGDQAWYACTGNSTESRHAGALAVAARVRAERPTCLVERAVALGCDVRVCEDVAGWLVAIHESSDLDEDVHRDVAASDVPATLARLLDEVEASRKGGAK
ncbi:MAG: hypothetical protein RIS45_905 [Planctomycetota bacterium]